MNTTTTATHNPIVEKTQIKSAVKTNWQLEFAEVIFWLVAAIQFILFFNAETFPEFTAFAMYNALPLCAVLAYSGIRKEQKKLSAKTKE